MSQFSADPERPREVQRSAQPPARRRHYYRVLRPRPLVPVSVTCLSARPLGLLTHYVEGRTTGCQGAERCPHCQRTDCPSKWEGYLWARENQGEVCIVVVTAEAYRGCADLADGQTDLTGRHLTLHRVGQAANSQVRAAVGAQQILPSRVRLPEDLYEYLTRLWAEQCKAK
jgi:hypothetical protein